MFGPHRAVGCQSCLTDGETEAPKCQDPAPDWRALPSPLDSKSGAPGSLELPGGEGGDWIWGGHCGTVVGSRRMGRRSNAAHPRGEREVRKLRALSCAVPSESGAGMTRETQRAGRTAGQLTGHQDATQRGSASAHPPPRPTSSQTSSLSQPPSACWAPGDDERPLAPMAGLAITDSLLRVFTLVAAAALGPGAGWRERVPLPVAAKAKVAALVGPHLSVCLLPDMDGKVSSGLPAWLPGPHQTLWSPRWPRRRVPDCRSPPGSPTECSGASRSGVTA